MTTLSSTITENEHIFMIKRNTTENVSVSENVIQKIAGFDMDSTLIVPKSNKKFPQNSSDWKWAFANVCEKINELKSNGFIVIIFTNQLGMRNGVREKMIEISEILNVHIIASKLKDWNRKPLTGMYEKIIEHLHLSSVCKPSSFYCGDACGRPQDFSDSDLKFSLNVGILFKQPEEIFLGHSAMHLQDIPSYYPHNTVITTDSSEPPYHNPFCLPPISDEKKEVVFMVGPPASGKSYFSSKLEDYVVINRDTLKTTNKCIKELKTNISQNKNIVIDCTNPSIKSRSTFIEHIPTDKYQIRCVVFDVPVSFVKHNNHYRYWLNECNTPLIPEIAYRMYYSNFEKPTTDEGFSEIYNINNTTWYHPTNPTLYRIHYEG